MILTIKGHFDAAHWLPNHPGKCSRMHGHRWEVELALKGKPVAMTGMIMDFKEVKDHLEKIIKQLDHRVLNDFLEQPTAENICSWIWEAVPHWLNPIWIRLWETPECSIMIREEDSNGNTTDKI